MQDSLLTFGLDSAGAMRLASSISKELGKRVPISFVFKHPTLQSMIDHFTQTWPAIVHSVREYKGEALMEYRLWHGAKVPMDKPLYLLGSGGHARTVVATLFSMQVPVSGIFTNLEEDVGENILGVEVLGLLSHVPAATECYLHISLGQPLLKMQWASQFPNHSYVTIVHPRAYVDTSCTFGEGSFVGALAVIDAAVSIGAHSIVEVHSMIGHDVVVGSFTLIGGMAAIAGASRIGDGVVMGTHSSTAPKVCLGNKSVLGSGSSAHVNVPEGCTAIGVPAEILYHDIPIKM